MLLRVKVFLILTTIIATSCIYLGILGLKGVSRRITRRLFFLLCCSMAWFIFCAGLSVSSAEKEGVIFWYRLSSFGFAPFYAFNLHFYINLTFGGRTKPWVYLLYLPVPLILGATLFSQSLFNEFIFINGNWRFYPAYYSPWFWVYVVYYFPFTAATVPIIHIRARQTGLKRHKKQAFYISLFALLTLLIGSLTDFVLTAFPGYTLPTFGPLTVAFYILGMWFVLMRFGFMEPLPSAVADVIIDNIEEMVFLLDPRFRIIRINRFARSILAIPEETSFQGADYADFTSDQKKTAKYLAYLRDSDKKSDTSGTVYTSGERDIHGVTYTVKLSDTLDEITGYLVMSREEKARADFIRHYRVTPREMEIVDLCLSGGSSSYISTRLKIAERTVETHLTNIFNKTGTNSRIELFALAAKYGIKGST